jgi:hypothetical protein
MFCACKFLTPRPPQSFGVQTRSHATRHWAPVQCSSSDQKKVLRRLSIFWMINGKVGENHDLKPLLGCEQRTSPLVTHSLSFPCTMYKFNPSSSVNSSNRQYNRMKIGQLSTTFKHEFHMYVNVQRSAIYMVRWGSSLGNRTVPMHNCSHSSSLTATFLLRYYWHRRQVNVLSFFTSLRYIV